MLPPRHEQTSGPVADGGREALERLEAARLQAVEQRREVARVCLRGGAARRVERVRAARVRAAVLRPRHRALELGEGERPVRESLLQPAAQRREDLARVRVRLTGRGRGRGRCSGSGSVVGVRGRAGFRVGEVGPRHRRGDRTLALQLLRHHHLARPLRRTLGCMGRAWGLGWFRVGGGLEVIGPSQGSGWGQGQG